MRVQLVLCSAVLAFSHLTWADDPATNSSNFPPNVILPAQLGPYPVAIYEHEVKTQRPDPLAPTAELRRLMVTVYRPFLDNFTCLPEQQVQVPYFPTVVADALLQLVNLDSPGAAAAFAPLHLVNCSRPFPAFSPSGPLALFSHGYGGTHHIYASTLLATASSGYTVVAIDHTYEAAAVVFPDNSVAYYSPITAKYDNSTEGQNFLQAVRIADSVSVLDAIERGEVPGFGSYSNSTSNASSKSSFSSAYNLDSKTSLQSLQAVMYGHSFGGSTAVNVALSDSRVLAGMNVDGPFYPPVVNSTFRKPLLMVSSSGQDGGSAEWPAFYKDHVCGWKTWVQPDNTVHYGYTDLPLLADLLGLRGTVLPESLIGTVDSRRLQEIVWRYTLQFFDYVVKDRTPNLLEGPSAEFPDVDFIGHAEAVKQR